MIESCDEHTVGAHCSLSGSDSVLPVGGQAVGTGLVQAGANLADVLGVLGVGQRLPVRFTIFACVRGLSAGQPRLR